MQRDLVICGPQPDDENPIASAIEFVAAQPGGPERLLRRHSRDGQGYCSSCGVGVCPVRWPCTIAAIASAARDRLATGTPDEERYRR